MIQDIAPHTFHNEYRNRAVSDQDVILVIESNKIWMKTEQNQIQLPTYKELYDVYGRTFHCQYLFLIDDIAFYAADLENDTEPLTKLGYVPYGNSTYRKYEPVWKVFACATGEQLVRWYQAHHFCGKCGSKLVQSKSQRALECSNCGGRIYPTISPCVIVAIMDGDRILLTRYANGPYKKYALVAGFAEIGESIEETVHREVMEETGLKVKNLRYYKSQPWGFTDTLLFGFYAELDGSDQVTLQEEELSEAVWIRRDELPDGGSKLSLTNEMIRRFRDGIE